MISKISFRFYKYTSFHLDTQKEKKMRTKNFVLILTKVILLVDVGIFWPNHVNLAFLILFFSFVFNHCLCVLLHSKQNHHHQRLRVRRSTKRERREVIFRSFLSLFYFLFVKCRNKRKGRFYLRPRVWPPSKEDVVSPPSFFTPSCPFTCFIPASKLKEAQQWHFLEF